MSAKITVVIVDPSVEPDIAEVTANYQTYQKIVGGYIQYLPTDDPEMIAYIDEEAKLKSGHTRNKVGTEMFERVSPGFLSGDDYIAGTIVFIGLDEEGAECSLTKEQLRSLKSAL